MGESVGWWQMGTQDLGSFGPGPNPGPDPFSDMRFPKSNPVRGTNLDLRFQEPRLQLRSRLRLRLRLLDSPIFCQFWRDFTAPSDGLPPHHRPHRLCILQRRQPGAAAANRAALEEHCMGRAPQPRGARTGYAANAAREIPRRAISRHHRLSSAATPGCCAYQLLSLKLEGLAGDPAWLQSWSSHHAAQFRLRRSWEIRLSTNPQPSLSTHDSGSP